MINGHFARLGLALFLLSGTGCLQTGFSADHAQASAAASVAPSAPAPPNVDVPAVTNPIVNTPAPNGSVAPPPSACLSVTPAQASNLQNLIDQNDCVTLGAGLYVIPKQLVMPSHHRLTGDANAILRANQMVWTLSGSDAVVASVSSVDVRVDGFTIDAAGVASYAVAARGMTVDHMRLTNGRCSGAGIAGAGMVITHNLITNSARTTVLADGRVLTCATGGGGGVAEGAGIYGEGQGDRYAPIIDGNEIRDGIGPALDINGVWGGRFTNNRVSNNTAWAGVSLYGASNWTIDGNQVSHPADQPPQPYHPDCARGPGGPGFSAAIFICQDTDQNNLIAANNVISNNQASGHFGILSVGALAKAPYLVPRNNTFLNNNVNGSVVGCADNFSPGQWLSDQDIWTGNTCGGSAGTGPIYFQ